MLVVPMFFCPILRDACTSTMTDSTGSDSLLGTVSAPVSFGVNEVTLRCALSPTCKFAWGNSCGEDVHKKHGLYAWRWRIHCD
jgi:hypothetical protein